MNRLIIYAIIVLGMSICHALYGDCFQDVAQRAESGSIPGLSPGSQEDNLPILLQELETCLHLSGSPLFLKLAENYMLLRTAKEGTEFEFQMTWVLADYVAEIAVSKSDVMKSLSPIWYGSTGKAKEIYFSLLSDFSRTGMLGPNRDVFWDFDFEVEKTLLNQEMNKTGELSLSLLDFMFTLAPGPALFTLNDTLTSGEKEALRQSVLLPIRLHKAKDPSSWEDINLEPGRDGLNVLVNSSYLYVDLFIAEIVNVVHDLRTPEVDAFLAQSTHPLVQRRLREPFVYVPLTIPD